MTTLTQKLRLQTGNNPTITNRLISDEGILPSDEMISAETSDSTRFHTVCKRVFRANPDYIPSAEYHGKIIYFCTESCLEAFLADSERFFCAHSQPASRK
jgi:YHS domain-containing protein